MKHAIIVLIVAIVLFIMIFNIKIKAAEEYEETNLHRVLASGKEWLNTSRSLTASDLKGRVILLDFWTFCCINCMQVIPDLHYLEKKFGNKLTVIGVHSAKFANERDKENIRNAVLRYDIEHPVINDADFNIWNRFGVRAWPTFMLINPAGKIGEVYSGEGHRESLEEDILSLTKKYRNLIDAQLPIELEKNKAPKTVLNFPGKLEYTKNIEGSPAIFIADSSNDRILGVRMDGSIFIQIGSGEQGFKDGDFTDAEFNTPQGLLYKDNKLYIADTNNHSLRLADFKNRTVSTIAGNGKQGYDRSVMDKSATDQSLASPWDLEFYPDADHIVIAMAGTHQLWTYSIPNKTVSVLAGNGRESIDDGRLPHNSLSQPSGLSAAGEKLYFVDSETSSLRVLEDVEITTLIGSGLFDFGFTDGDKNSARMQHSLGVYANGNEVYIADSYNHSIRKYDTETGQLSTIYGDGKRASLNEPNGIIFIEEKFYITDTNNHQVKILNKDGHLSTFEVFKISNEMPVDDLPNVDYTTYKVSNSVLFDFVLPDGWKFNNLAPTWLSLFNEEGNLVKKYSEKDLTEPLEINDLSGDQYRLQGTFYYCEDKIGSLCLIQSIDTKLVHDNNNSVQVIKVELKK